MNSVERENDHLHSDDEISISTIKEHAVTLKE